MHHCLRSAMFLHGGETNPKHAERCRRARQNECHIRAGTARDGTHHLACCRKCAMLATTTAKEHRTHSVLCNASCAACNHIITPEACADTSAESSSTTNVFLEASSEHTGKPQMFLMSSFLDIRFRRKLGNTTSLRPCCCHKVQSHLK